MTLPDYWRSALDPERVMRVSVTHWNEGNHQPREEQLTVEEPFEIQIGHQSLAVIMRTPGHDRELAMGFLFSEGVIHHPDDVASIEEALDSDGLPLPNVLNILLHNPAQQAAIRAQPTAFERHFAVSASCGLCGKNSIADLLHEIAPLPADDLRIPAQTLYGLAEQLRARQTVFGYTGGLHAAALFSPFGELLHLREDVGRHNAVDKLIGHGLLHRTLPSYKEYLLLVSGRTSYEIIQKALQARLPFVVAISAPSSLAVELAASAGITLVGFLRGHSMNVYTHPERLL